MCREFPGLTQQVKDSNCYVDLLTAEDNPYYTKQPPKGGRNKGRKDYWLIFAWHQVVIWEILSWSIVIFESSYNSWVGFTTSVVLKQPSRALSSIRLKTKKKECNCWIYFDTLYLRNLKVILCSWLWPFHKTDFVTNFLNSTSQQMRGWLTSVRGSHRVLLHYTTLPVIFQHTGQVSEELHRKIIGQGPVFEELHRKMIGESCFVRESKRTTTTTKNPVSIQLCNVICSRMFDWFCITDFFTHKCGQTLFGKFQCTRNIIWG